MDAVVSAVKNFSANLPINKRVVVIRITVYSDVADKQQQTRNRMATSTYAFAELTPTVL